MKEEGQSEMVDLAVDMHLLYLILPPRPRPRFRPSHWTLPQYPPKNLFHLFMAPVTVLHQTLRLKQMNLRSWIFVKVSPVISIFQRVSDLTCAQATNGIQCYKACLTSPHSQTPQALPHTLTSCMTVSSSTVSHVQSAFSLSSSRHAQKWLSTSQCSRSNPVCPLYYPLTDSR